MTINKKIIDDIMNRAKDMARGKIPPITDDQKAQTTTVMPTVVQKSLAMWFTIKKGQPTERDIEIMMYMIAAWKGVELDQQAMILAQGWDWYYDACEEFLRLQTTADLKKGIVPNTKQDFFE